MVYGILTKSKVDFKGLYGDSAPTYQMTLTHLPSRVIGGNTIEPHLEPVELNLNRTEINLENIRKMLTRYDLGNKVSRIIPVGRDSIMIIPLSSIYSEEIMKKLKYDEFYNSHFEPPKTVEQLPEPTTGAVNPNRKPSGETCDETTIEGENSILSSPTKPVTEEIIKMYEILDASRGTI
jgi:hypothetical protein